MAQNTQLTSFHVQGGDIPFTNTGSVDIPEGHGVILDPAAYLCGSLPATAGPVTGQFGIAVDKIPVGKTGRVRTAGIALAKADGGITGNTYVCLSSTSTKEGRVKTAGAGAEALAKALLTVLDGELCPVFLSPARNA